MNKTDKVLKTCIRQTRRDIAELNVFDLMYETCLTYPELKGILDELISQKELEQIDIKTYKFIGDLNREFEERETKAPDIQTILDSLDKDDDLDERLAFLEERSKELIKRMTDETDDDDGDIDEDDEDDLFGELTKIEKTAEDYGLRYRVLKHCIEKGHVSVAMLQRTFPIGYLESCKLVDWMESMGYISAAEGCKPRKILITLDDFNKMFDEPE